MGLKRLLTILGKLQAPYLFDRNRATSAGRCCDRWISWPARRICGATHR
jgi:hypothetical protein